MKKLILALLVAFGGVQTATAMLMPTVAPQIVANTVDANLDSGQLNDAMSNDNVRWDFKDTFMKGTGGGQYSLDTSLYLATAYGYPHVLALLLNNGGREVINKADQQQGTTLLYHACEGSGRRTNPVGIARLLFENGALESINTAATGLGINGLTPLHRTCCARDGNIDLAKLLLAHGAGVYVNSSGMPPFGTNFISNMGDAVLGQSPLPGYYSQPNNDFKRLLIVYKLAHENAQFLSILQDVSSSEDEPYSIAQRNMMGAFLTQEQLTLINDLYPDIDSTTQIIDQWLTDRNHIKELIRKENERVANSQDEFSPHLLNCAKFYNIQGERAGS